MKSFSKSYLAAIVFALIGLTASVSIAGEKKDIVDTAVSAGSFKTLAAALGAADLVDALKSDGPFTVFAPTDEAFAKLPKGTVEYLLKPENKGQLVAVLNYHVVAGKIPASKVLKLDQATTLEGQQVAIKSGEGKVKVGNANVVKTDIQCSNGIIHVIDSVLLPPKKTKVGAADKRRMIEHAVARGVDLYNAGHHAACAKIYTSTAREMIKYGHQMPPLVMSSLKSALTTAEKTHCPTKKAWVLRRGLDRVYYAMLDHNQW